MPFTVSLEDAKAAYPADRKSDPVPRGHGKMSPVAALGEKAVQFPGRPDCRRCPCALLVRLIDEALSLTADDLSAVLALAEGLHPRPGPSAGPSAPVPPVLRLPPGYRLRL